MNEIVLRMLALQGVRLPEERAESVARTLAAQHEAERAATRALAFEQEPSGFFRTLEQGSK